MALDRGDMMLSQARLLRSAKWEDLRDLKVVKIYAGRLFRSEEQFQSYIGLSKSAASTRNICHDLCSPFPIESGSVDVFQSQDVFEHIELANVPLIVEEIYRVLKVDGLFRLSVPDYRFDGYRSRCIFDSSGGIIHDPQGGGQLKDGRVVDGGHVWFPVFETVQGLLSESSFGTHGKINFLHYTKSDGSYVLRDIDHSLGRVKRTPDHDIRSQKPRRPQSIVVDCYKTS